MELIIITHPDYFDGEGELINALFGTGLQLLHLRKPENDSTKFRKLMLEIDPGYYPLISIHQHHELASEFSIKRLHYPEQLWKHINWEKRMELFIDGFHLSRSIHEWGPFVDTAFLDYVFYGPVFNSVSKAGYQSIVNKDFYLSDIPKGLKVFALGGIKGDQIGSLKQMNFDGAAVLGAIWSHPATAVKEFEEMLKSL